MPQTPPPVDSCASDFADFTITTSYTVCPLFAKILDPSMPWVGRKKRVWSGSNTHTYF